MIYDSETIQTEAGGGATVYWLDPGGANQRMGVVVVNGRNIAGQGKAETVALALAVLREGSAAERSDEERPFITGNVSGVRAFRYALSPDEVARLYSEPAEVHTVTARIKLRNDNGPSGELSEPKEFVCVDGEYYEKDWIRSAPGLRAEQLEF